MISTATRGLVALLLACAALTAPALADSTNAEPVITLTDTPFDANALPWVAAETKTFLSAQVASLQKGELTSMAIAAAPNGVWGYRATAAGGYAAPSITDTVRQALEQCEFYNVMPCYLVSVNGKSTADTNGSYATQPHMLRPDPAAFDYTRVPFAPELDRRNLRDYGLSAGPKAMALHDNGYWGWKTGTTIADAITQAMATCKTGNGDVDCQLYAVNNTVVMDFPR